MRTDRAQSSAARPEIAKVKASRARSGYVAWGLRSTVAVVALALLGGCATSSGIAPAGGEPGPTATNVITTTTASRSIPSSTSTTVVGPDAFPVAALGEFPEAPEDALPEAVANSLQSLLDESVSNRTIGGGVVAGVILAGSGSWSGASGVDVDGERLTPGSQLIVASIGKTVTAAQVLRLVDDGVLDLLDPITDHLPPEAASAFDANGATIQDLLGMRSGLQDPFGYEGLVDSGLTPIELLERLPGPTHTAGATIIYVNMNYILLGMIIEHETGVALATALESGVLNPPGLAGITYPVTDALAADGWKIASDALTLARWGYELYGGFVVSEDSLRAMTDFEGGWYGLGTIDFQAETPAAGVVYDRPAIGHGGLEPPSATALVVFPESGLVVAVQAASAGLEQIFTLVGALRDVVGT
ncbi:MAG TPA: serine hydrolase domain-containing protein [Acidimicrobiia bacterium]|nr:serine hydrolase domain-containing protein [Acidimicrobiia bacterium]